MSIDKTSLVALLLCFLPSLCLSTGYYELNGNITSIQVDLVPGFTGEYPCIGALQIDRWDVSRLLVGLCTRSSSGLSGAIGYLQSYTDSGLTQSVNVLYGDITSSRPIRGNVTDGYNISAEMISPQYLYQTSDRRILFSDVKSCGRQIQIDTELVSTVHGPCSLSGTLDLSDTVTFNQSLIFGMTYYEDRDMWVYALVNLGIYVYSGDGSNSRRLVNIVDISHTVTDSVQQIIQDPTDIQIMWQKVSRGINKYNMTDIDSINGDIIHGDNFWRFVSYTGRFESADSTALYYNQTDGDEIGQTDAELLFSPSAAPVITIADTEQDRLFFIDTRNGDQQVLCTGNSSYYRDGHQADCVFQSISAAFWRDDSELLIYERLADVFRVVRLDGPAIPTTTSSTASTSTSTSPSTTSTLRPTTSSTNQATTSTVSPSITPSASSINTTSALMNDTDTETPTSVAPPSSTHRDISDEGTWWVVLAVVSGACSPIVIFWIVIKVIQCRRYGMRFDLFSDEDDLNVIDPLTAQKINFLYNKAVTGQEYQEKPPSKEASKSSKKRYRPKSSAENGNKSKSPRGSGKKKSATLCTPSSGSASASIIDKFRLPPLRKKKKKTTSEDLEELQPVRRKSGKSKPRPPSMNMQFAGNTVSVPVTKTELGRARPLPVIPKTI